MAAVSGCGLLFDIPFKEYVIIIYAKIKKLYKIANGRKNGFPVTVYSERT
jgi:hypothetical protein